MKKQMAWTQIRQWVTCCLIGSMPFARTTIVVTSGLRVKAIYSSGKSASRNMKTSNRSKFHKICLFQGVGCATPSFYMYFPLLYTLYSLWEEGQGVRFDGRWTHWSTAGVALVSGTCARLWRVMRFTLWTHQKQGLVAKSHLELYPSRAVHDKSWVCDHCGPRSNSQWLAVTSALFAGAWILNWHRSSPRPQPHASTDKMNWIRNKHNNYTRNILEILVISISSSLTESREVPQKSTYEAILFQS